EPNYVYRAAGVPNDPLFPQLWGLDSPSDADIDAPEAWDLTTGSSSVTVAVVDTGVAADHPELSPNLWVNAGESGTAAGNGLDDDRNGYVDDARGWDWIGDDATPRDLHGHGTHVAGTIAARGNDAAGISGISWASKVMPLRVLNSQGAGNTADIASAFTYAARNGAQVVNASLGGNGYSLALLNAINSAPETLFVVAAGNAGANNDVNASYPCNYPAPNVVCVAASDSNDELASYSNYGATTVDLAAPGSGILSVQPSFAYRFTEHFDGDLAATWTTGGVNGTWTRDPGGFAVDSAAGNYQDGADHWMATNDPVDLSGVGDCLLRYSLRLDAETDHDALVTEASADGSDWRVVGDWTGSSGGKWIGVSDSLAAFDGAPAVHLRFRFESDIAIARDGAAVDHISVQCSSSSYNGSELQYASGTSMAAPHVAGVAALAWSAKPDAGVTSVVRALVDGADDKQAFTAKTLSGGRLNACRTVVLVTGSGDCDGLSSTSAPSATPSPAPTATPSPAPSATPTPAPSATPSPAPTASPDPSTAPDPEPSASPQPEGQVQPEPEPSASPKPEPEADPVVHSRKIRLRLTPGLKARGKVAVPDGFEACRSSVIVKVVRNGRVIGKVLTRGDGSFSVFLDDRKGRYRVRTPKHEAGGHSCAPAKSRLRRA
ncbi:MAG: S8 family serine peptidase, partial [Actinomycetota bacterium]|nr:S8 family serine peptidase [Actinomycetota bacterium]